MFWKEFTYSKKYKDLVEEMKRKGMVQPHIDNILFSAFGAGYFCSKM